MDKHTLDVLGFGQLRELVAGRCQTDIGRGLQWLWRRLLGEPVPSPR